MKLLNITNRYYIIIALALLVISSTFLAYRVLYLVDMQVSEHMLFEKQEIEKQLATQPDIQNLKFIIGDRIEVEPLEKFTTFQVQLTDTTAFDSYENIEVPFRVLRWQQLIGGDAYRITLSKRLTATIDYLDGVLLTLLLVAIDIIACFYFLNRYISRRVWRPFYRALRGLKNFDIHHGEKLTFQRSRVEEFDALNSELSKLTDKVARDYKNLREFTENMSHETQTPLAIIRSKLELLLQSENLRDEQVAYIQSSLDSVNRLSKMNKSLILLTRIENEQYSEEQVLPLAKTLSRMMEDLEPFVDKKEMRVEMNLDNNVRLKINKHLSEIMLSNLISNAIRHGERGGLLKIDLDKDHLLIANSGGALPISDDQIFERFKKGNQPDSVGLGLAIVKKICDHCKCDIHYSYEEGLHRFLIVFDSKKVNQFPESAISPV